MRFEEFLRKKEEEAAREEQENAKVEISFYSDDSFALLVNGPAIKPPKPQNVPDLCLNGLPEYETSSEEEDETEKNHDYSLSQVAKQ